MKPAKKYASAGALRRALEDLGIVSAKPRPQLTSISRACFGSHLRDFVRDPPIFPKEYIPAPRRIAHPATLSHGVDVSESRPGLAGYRPLGLFRRQRSRTCPASARTVERGRSRAVAIGPEAKSRRCCAPCPGARISYAFEGPGVHRGGCKRFEPTTLRDRYQLRLAVEPAAHRTAHRALPRYSQQRDVTDVTVVNFMVRQIPHFECSTPNESRTRDRGAARIDGLSKAVLIGVGRPRPTDNTRNNKNKEMRCKVTHPYCFLYSSPRWSGYLACNALIRSSNSGRLRKLARLGSFRK